jgi:hypothetical protein
MATTPNRPGEQLDEGTLRILRERMATFDDDKKEAKPWDEVKARILQSLKPR